MKKTFRWFTALSICAVLIASCTKEPTPEPTPEPEPEPTIETGLEGQFMPERKIASTETFDLIGEDSLRPVVQNNYEWNGDLLFKMTQTQFTGSFVMSQTFHYDSINRIAKIDYDKGEQGSYTMEYLYEGKELAKINQYKENGELYSDYTFIRTDGKVTEIQSYTYLETTEYSFKTLVWEGDNIIQRTTKQYEDPVPTTFTFDDKINPFHGLCDASIYLSPETVYSVNNVLTTTMVAVLTSTLTYEYEYDDKGYPVKATSVKNVGPVNITSITNFTYLE